ncbi:MAG: hypothetical protein HY208_09325 [Nitrospirae bacterium]|nr:hypothetical protein [Nitrospirota bacterium]
MRRSIRCRPCGAGRLLRSVLFAVTVGAVIVQGAPVKGAVIGEPTATGSPGQFRVESEVDYATQDVEAGRQCCLESKAVRLLIKFSGLAHRRVELFGRLGGLIMQTLQGPVSPNIDGSAAIAVGGGFKVTLYERGPLAWGAGGQVLYHESKDSGLPATITWQEVDLFTGPTVILRPGVDVYGGLLGSLVVGELHRSGGSADLDQHTPLGLLLGGRAMVTRSVFFGLELRLVDQASASSRVGVVF